MFRLDRWLFLGKIDSRFLVNLRLLCQRRADLQVTLENNEKRYFYEMPLKGSSNLSVAHNTSLAGLEKHFSDVSVL